jgi:hypothetical protein
MFLHFGITKDIEWV